MSFCYVCWDISHVHILLLKFQWHSKHCRNQGSFSPIADISNQHLLASQLQSSGFEAAYCNSKEAQEMAVQLVVAGTTFDIPGARLRCPLWKKCKVLEQHGAVKSWKIYSLLYINWVNGWGRDVNLIRPRQLVEGFWLRKVSDVYDMADGGTGGELVEDCYFSDCKIGERCERCAWLAPGPLLCSNFKLFSLGWLSLQVTKTHPAVLTTCTTFFETINYDFRLNPNDWSLQTGTLSTCQLEMFHSMWQAAGAWPKLPWRWAARHWRRTPWIVRICAVFERTWQSQLFGDFYTDLYSIFSVHSTDLHRLWAHHNFAAAFCRPGHTRREIGNSMHAALWYAPQLVFTGEMVWDLPSGPVDSQ